MADTKISALADHATPADADYLPIVDSTGPTTKRVTVANLRGAPSDAKYIVSAANSGLSAEIVIPNLGSSPDSPPAAPNTENDEFDATTLDAKWTESTTAGAHDHGTTWPSAIFVKFTGNQNYQLRQAYAPAGDFSLTVCAYVAHLGNYQTIDLAIYDDDESESVLAAYKSDVGVKATLSTRDANIWTNNRASLTLTSQNKVYLHVQRATDTWSVWVSFDGYSFWRAGTYSKTFTVHHFIIYLGQNGITTPVRVGLEWVRRDWVTL